MIEELEVTELRDKSPSQLPLVCSLSSIILAFILEKLPPIELRSNFVSSVYIYIYIYITLRSGSEIWNIVAITGDPSLVPSSSGTDTHPVLQLKGSEAFFLTCDKHEYMQAKHS